MSDQTLMDYSADNGIARIRFDRAEKKNALTHAMYEDWLAALDRAEADTAVQAVLVCGSTEAFTAGNDIADFLQRPPRDDDAPVMRLLARLPTLAKPLVAAVCGPAVGIGTSFLLHCDLVVCGEHSRFALPFVNLGLCAEGGSSLLLAQRVGSARAAEWLLLGEPFGAQDALSAGLVNRVVPEAEVLPLAETLARRLAAKPAQALQTTRRLLREGMREATRQAISREAEAFRQLLDTPEARAAFARFLDRNRDQPPA